MYVQAKLFVHLSFSNGLTVTCEGLFFNFCDFQHNSSDSQHNKPAQSSQSFINFVSAKRRNLTNKAASKLQGRAKDLLEIIELETIGHSLFEHQPTKEYDLFIQSFGQSNTTQASSMFY
jgi:hypothetical protein